MVDKIFPLQPIEDNRFISNRIVEALLASSSLNLNVIATMDFTAQERIQFAQLIGYSLCGFGELTYVDDESYDAALKQEAGQNELEARNEVLREQLNLARTGIRDAATALFNIHPDDLEP